MPRLTNEEKATKIAERISAMIHYVFGQKIRPETERQIADMIIEEFPGHDRKTTTKEAQG